MPTITITGDTTQKALEQVLYRGIGLYGKDFNVVISENLRFENQNEEIKDYKQKVRDAIDELKFPDRFGDTIEQIKERLKEGLGL